jgi:hypothetical protein
MATFRSGLNNGVFNVLARFFIILMIFFWKIISVVVILSIVSGSLY